jgi:hypothetical protein
MGQAHVSSSDSESEFEDPIPIDTDDDNDDYDAELRVLRILAVYFLNKNVGRSGYNAHSAKHGVTVTALGTQTMLFNL